MSRAPHPPGCMCSHCHLSSKLFPRGHNDRIILPRPTNHGEPKSPTMGDDRARYAPPRPQSTAPGEYRSRHHHEPPPPMPPMPRGYGEPSSPSTSRRSMDQRAPPPMPKTHRPSPSYAQPTPDRSYTFAPPDRPASAMAMSSRTPASPTQQQPGNGQNIEWTAPRLKWVEKKQRVSHFTPPSQYQGTSFRQYVHDGVSTRPPNQ
ncbi:hypothetical protein K438DRAFT_2017407 [Mycena galopus ATCC 62051]|nr:hypothetical protein K438DRAFT_2017407 [Mycena galopus ATCC 62051]